MSDRPFQFERGRLAECARRDAERISPGFSDALHARVMQVVGELEAPSLAFPQSADEHSAARYWVSPLSAAAVVALLILPAVLLTSDHGGALSVVTERVATSPHRAPSVTKPQFAVYSTAHAVNYKVQTAVQTAMAREQFAGLDHDLQAATRYLVDQVPLRSAWESPSRPGGP